MCILNCAYRSINFQKVIWNTDNTKEVDLYFHGKFFIQNKKQLYKNNIHTCMYMWSQLEFLYVFMVMNYIDETITFPSVFVR